MPLIGKILSDCNAVLNKCKRQTFPITTMSNFHNIIPQCIETLWFLYKDFFRYNLVVHLKRLYPYQMMMKLTDLILFLHKLEAVSLDMVEEDLWRQNYIASLKY